MATVIGVDGSSEEISLPTELEAFQKLVDGYIEVIRLPDGSAMIVNEDGKMKEMPINKAASLICMMKNRPEMLVGPAVFISREEFARFVEGQ